MNRWRERRKFWLFALPLALLLALLSAGPALAHTRLVDTTPGDGAQLTTVPRVVSLTFSGDVLKLGAAVKISGPDGTAAAGPVRLKGRTISWPVTGELGNGKYAVSWRVTAADGHPVDGRFGFVLRAPVEPTGTPSPADPTAGPTPTVTAHTAEPQMTGPMEGMEGMPGMASGSPGAAGAASGSSTTTGLAIAGLVLLTVIVAGAIVIERRRRPPPGAGPSAPASG